MMYTPIYVDKALIAPIGAKLVGSSVTHQKSTEQGAGFNWFLQASLQISQESGVETRIAELFPEDILRFVYDRIDPARLSVRELCERVQRSELVSADVVSLVGEFSVPDVAVGHYNPFDPPEIKIARTFRVSGEECLAAVVTGEAFRFPVFFRVESKETVCYAGGKPVEVVGVLKWSPSYEVAGYAMNQIVLGAALLLQR